MAVSKAQQKAQNKWISKTYDRINLTVPKGKKAEIQVYAEISGESVNGFINRAIDETMNGDKGAQKPVEARSWQGAIITPQSLKTAQEAAQNAGEDVPTFIWRAVDTQAQRDRMTAAMKKTPDA